MVLDIPWFLLGSGVFLWFAICLREFTRKKIITREKFLQHFGSSLEGVLGIYAVLYALIVIVYNTLGVQVNIPQDDGALTIALLYGGAHIFHRWIKTILQ